MTLFKKISWRFKFIRKAVPQIITALSKKEKQPWQYIYDYWFIPSEKRYMKSKYYLENNLLPGITMSNNKINLQGNTIDLSNTTEDKIILLGVIAEYFDFIYPKFVKTPISFFITEGPYEKEGCIIKEGDVVIDAGANLGLFSWLMKDIIGEKGKIYMFEPIESLSKILKNSIHINKTENVMTVVEKALSDENGYTYFSVENFTGGSHRNDSGSTEIPMITIDTYVSENNIPKIDFIKADIEGMEPNLIKGASETIKRDKPRIAICTYHDRNHRKELTELLKNLRSDYTFAYSSHKLFAW